MSDKHVVLSCHFDSDELLLIAGFVDRPSSSKWRMFWPISNRKNSSNLDDNVPIVNCIAARKFKLEGIQQGFVHTVEDFANSFRRSLKEFLENDLEIHDKEKAKELGIPIREDANCVAISQVLLSKINDSIIHEKEYIVNLLMPLIKNDFFDQDHEPYIPPAFEPNASVARLFENDILSAKYSLNINLGFKSTGIIFIDSSDPEQRVQQSKQFFMGYADLLNSHRSYLQENYLKIFEQQLKRIEDRYQEKLGELNQKYSSLHRENFGNLPALNQLDQNYTSVLKGLGQGKRRENLALCKVYNAQDYYNFLVSSYDFYPETAGHTFKLFYNMNLRLRDMDKSFVFTIQNLVSKAYQQFQELDRIQNVRFRSDFLENFQVSLSGYFPDLPNIEKTVRFLFTKLYAEDKEQYLRSKKRLSADTSTGASGLSDSLRQFNLQSSSPNFVGSIASGASASLRANQGTVTISGDSLTAGASGYSSSYSNQNSTNGLPAISGSSSASALESTNYVLYPKSLGITDLLKINIILHKVQQFSHHAQGSEDRSRVRIIRQVCRGFTNGFERKVHNLLYSVSYHYDVELGKEVGRRLEASEQISASPTPIYRDLIYKSNFNEYSVAAGMILMNYDIGESKPISVMKKSVSWVKVLLKFD